ncbi:MULTISPECIES: phosphatidylinositol phosphate synthase [Nocardiopsis]|uniref:Phosphatidylinositol phosphate synthase n=2 Tax=Nocardiopsis alba TaxID=53437 RepID=A0A7K2IX22_9ACTN|nr:MULTISPECIES: CDP-alcohol phosphatidyltransferase family protein [Nocardiopsis]AFR07174.1 CDP-diacylglycerol--inositol 3-phosphatidyltransferase [Nocardiopsis alba ATCC BAA-2165]MEC3892238.1 CDP-alcohol phosphatidyltransferase family protein [Nocardiopsis sp. LDBS1602]MYR34396.1 CDP-alcohol phosphatidyltransferase family protein [Nocardiopsis alba]
MISRVTAPLGRSLARIGLTPNIVTIIGAAGVVVSALYFYPRGQLYAGSVVITVFALFDMLDGAVARAKDSASAFGAFLDSSLDRVADAAILAGLMWWFVGEGDDPLLAGLTLFCLISGFMVSYIKARAEGLGVNCDVGVAERTERLIIILVAVGLSELGVPYILAGGLWLLAGMSLITVLQRLVETRARLNDSERSRDEETDKADNDA